MDRSKKLLIVGLVLVVGFGLAWPFRKTGNEIAVESASLANSETVDLGRAATEAARQSFSHPRFRQQQRLAQQQPTRQQASQHQPTQHQPVGSPAPHVVAKMTKLGDAGVLRRRTPSAASFDLANHPALATPLSPHRSSPVTPPLPPQQQTPPLLTAETEPLRPRQQKTPALVRKYQSHSRPAYTTTDRDLLLEDLETHETEVRHVVQNSDTLEKLAKRYLGDEGRALEIFDLNRDVLDNPHLLPINAELRIPGRSSGQ